MSNNYSTPAWSNGTTPPINASNLTTMGRAIETASPLYGVSSTAAATAAKSVTVSYTGTLSLYTGLTVNIKFSNSNTASSPTLNVNSTGAKAIKSYGTTDATKWQAGQLISFTYDGTNWLITGFDSFTKDQTLDTATATDFYNVFGTTPTYPKQALSMLANGCAKIAAGSYVGTGSNPTTLTFSFAPKLVIVSYENDGLIPYSHSGFRGWYQSFVWFSGQTTTKFIRYNSFASSYDSFTLTFTESSNSLSWNSSLLNESGMTYEYLAIGV